ncbi:MAG: hypothetical protein KGQ46_12195 [Hyphomicrobiales bacterium]|nr:hypothetical protein [Hyphomicrobiales bacterium]MDE2115188.1 hypothetical protein [Hyphomicrobiales bacterium]
MINSKPLLLPSQLQNIADLGNDKTLDMRPVIFRVACDLFVTKQHHPIEEVQQFSELFNGMLASVSDDILLPLVKKLAGHPQFPQSIQLPLLHRGNEIVKIVLQNARSLREFDLTSLDIWHNAEICRVLAARPDLTQAHVSRLIEASDDAMLVLIAGNLSAPLDAAAKELMLARAIKLVPLAQCLLQRQDINREHPALFFAASSDQRNAIIVNAQRQELGKPIQPVELTHAKEASLLRLERLAIAGDRSGLTQQLALVLECEVFDAARLISDATGEAFALALVASGLQRDAAVRMFLSLHGNISHEYRRIVQLSNIVSQVPQAAAQKLIKGMLGLGVRREVPSMPAGANGALDASIHSKIARFAQHQKIAVLPGKLRA